MPSFNFIAPYYDLLSEIIYGNNLNKAKKYYFNQLPTDAIILIMGGGTGSILNEVLEKYKGIKIDYVEPSAGMIAIAKRKLKKEYATRINFICGDQFSIPENKIYDAVTSFFVLDCFKQQEAIEFGKAITKQLKPDGLWLFADFHKPKIIFKRFLLWVMYRLFKITAGISASHLPDYDLLFREINFRCIAEQPFMNGFIYSKVFVRK